MKDLHIHTKYSDGQYDEKEILDRIIKAGITEFAICDHDTIEGSKRVKDLIEKQNININFHSGVELSCKLDNMFGGINFHMLARDFDLNSPYLKSLLDELQKLRMQKIPEMKNFIKQIYNIDIPQYKIDEKIKTTNSFGKPHFYELLSEYITCDSDDFHLKMKRLESRKFKIDAKVAIDYIHKANGNITLAHPIEIMQEYNLNYNDIEKLVKYLASIGLDGLETRHSKQTQKDYEIFSNIAKKYGLFETCGSDFHGEKIKPKAKLGVCIKE